MLIFRDELLLFLELLHLIIIINKDFYKDFFCRKLCWISIFSDKKALLEWDFFNCSRAWMKSSQKIMKLRWNKEQLISQFGQEKGIWRNIVKKETNWTKLNEERVEETLVFSERPSILCLVCVCQQRMFLFCIIQMIQLDIIYWWLACLASIN